MKTEKNMWLLRHLHVFHVLSYLLITLSLVMLICAIYSLVVKEPDAASLFISAFTTGFAGLALRFLTPFSKEITLMESFMLVTLAWVLAGALGALPYLFSGVFTGYLDAFFESISGFTTTGATLIINIEDTSRGVLLWRSFTQWLGGMGIIVMFVALLPQLGYRAMNLFRAEMPGVFTERVVPRVSEMAKRLWFIYLFLTVLLFLLLLLARVPVYHALNHALTTMPTGGFSTFNASVAGMENPLVEVIITVFMFLAGINFALYYMLVRGGIPHFRDAEFRFYLTLVIISIILVTINISARYNPGETFRLGAFQVVSIMTTTGYTTANFDAWPSFSRALLLVFMFVGGSGGSTAGAMKQVRIQLLMKYAFREISRLLHPTAVTAVKVGGRPVPEEILRNVLAFSFLYLFSFTLAFLSLSAMGLEMVTAFSAVAACIGNVGPGLGLVGPEHTFGVIPAAGKLVLSFMMVLGRLEIFTVLTFLLLGWRRS